MLCSKKVGTLPGSNSAIARFLANCPDNAFQRVQPGGSSFSLGQRTGAILRNGVKLLAVGFGSSVIGVGATQALSAVRTLLDPEFTTPNPPQNLLAVSAAYASYMGISSNLRYQVRLPCCCLNDNHVPLQCVGAVHIHAIFVQQLYARMHGAGQHVLL